MSDIEYHVIIGLEVHAQLLTSTKMFCGCSTVFGAPANTQICPVCSGLPGVLPVLNRRAVELALRMGLATRSTITPVCQFARKNYFYPDLPKGYQISQYESPLCLHGAVDIQTENGEKAIGLIRIHLEEDAGKSIHDDTAAFDETKLDLNRCGTPLIEVVSQPDMASSQEAYLYLTKVRQMLQYLGVCDGNMEEGSLRCDANVNIRYLRDGAWIKTPISEIKNLNSFRYVQKALDEGVKRQLRLLDDRQHFGKETLQWNPAKNELVTMRSKEEAHDYRYFPEPDLVVVAVEPAWIEKIKLGLPELPQAKKERFVREYALPVYNAEVLTAAKDIADFFEACLKTCPVPQRVSNWIMGEIMGVLNEQNIPITQFPLTPRQIGELLQLVESNTISGKIAKTIFIEMLKTKKDAGLVLKEQGLAQIVDQAAIEKEIDAVLAAHPKEIAAYQSGQVKIFGFLVGQVMKKTAGKANPQLLNQILKKKLGV
jgi:aspartyl-tRNA(Asn)/glutamyl-tRNA(Gln) amidotransferase subunit B